MSVAQCCRDVLSNRGYLNVEAENRAWATGSSSLVDSERSKLQNIPYQPVLERKLKTDLHVSVLVYR
jgi:hypothetical protein